ncbi:MAG: acyl-CoA carboxylase subunit beta [Candidatus Accumulibacter sp.]|jgi:acetyl-CoA/propionyl-CoA carboxylase carboxyl transferase subunit|nr:acyl-CoA carboxylase subunit beta [Accumulibacter sp.]
MGNTEKDIATLLEKRKLAMLGGGQKRIDDQHKKGKKTARERIDYLLDPGSFHEFGTYATHSLTTFGLDKQRFIGDGVVTGFGKIGGRPVALFSQDFTVMGGSFSEVQSQKISRIADKALDAGIPLIGIGDSGGARIQEGVRSLAAYGEIFVRNVMCSGVIPQLQIILGPCAGGAVYSPALMDFIVMAGTSYMFLTGPQVIKTVTGEEVTTEDLGGAAVHTGTSGVAHLAAETEEEGLDLIKKLLTYLPQNNNEEPAPVATDDSIERQEVSLNTLIPDDPNSPYDIRDVISQVFDRDSFFEIQPDWAANAVVGFARMEGRSVAVIANQPSFMGGALDINSSDKIARHVRIADAFNIPIVTFVDCPGFLPGTGQEYGGVIRHGAKILYAYCEATVPMVSIVTRKAMGGAYLAMNSRQMRSDLTFSWPSGQIAVMGAEGAVNILYMKDIKEAADPKARKAEIIESYREEFLNPYRAADVGQTDDVIVPSETRPRLARALEVLRTKVTQNPPRKHGLMPV